MKMNFCINKDVNRLKAFTFYFLPYMSQMVLDFSILQKFLLTRFNAQSLATSNLLLMKNRSIFKEIDFRIKFWINVAEFWLTFYV